jgi:3-dehydrosphinganine reductase
MLSFVDRILRALGFSDLVGTFHPLVSVAISLVLVFIVLVVLNIIFLSKPPKEFKGKKCLITGGSKGTGKALAKLLAKEGASITILARNQKDLDDDLKEVKEFDANASAVSCDVTNYEQVKQAVDKVGDVDYLFTCAGQALPGMFLEQPIEEMRKGMDLNYFGTLNVIKATSDGIVKRNGGIVMCASVLGLFGLVGYSQYAPTKFALRGLAEVLRQELPSVSVHIFFPGTILSPGFEDEQKRKPEITKHIEGEDGQSCEAIADAMLSGVKRGQFMITSDIIGELARCTGIIAPGNGLSDGLLSMLGWLIFPLWRMYADSQVSSYFSKAKTD